MFEPIDITVTDPRNFDGTPYEVAARAVAQVEGALIAASHAADAAFLMARNAEMERNLALGLPPAGSEYGAGPQGRKFSQIADDLVTMRRTLSALTAAVAYDPKHPPKP
jgi:hypothetical protein